MSYATVTCGKCKQTDSLDRFTFGQPKDYFQCPHCKLRFKVVDDPPTVMPSGFIMPGRRKVVET